MNVKHASPQPSSAGGWIGYVQRASFLEGCRQEPSTNQSWRFISEYFLNGAKGWSQSDVMHGNANIHW